MPRKITLAVAASFAALAMMLTGCSKGSSDEPYRPSNPKVAECIQEQTGTGLSVESIRAKCESAHGTP